MSDFIAEYDSFSQFYSMATLGVEPGVNEVACSVNFDEEKSFYGDAYEIFSSSFDLLAMLHNVGQNGSLDQFQSMTLKKYRTLDKSSRFNPFVMNLAFSAVCEEQDNQIRNAAHHKGMSLSADGRTIIYRAGRGGTGEERQMSYASYLYRSNQLVLQICTLWLFALVVGTGMGVKMPYEE